VQAIIQDRGRQYLVDVGQTLLIDHLASAEPGAEHVFDSVLMLGETVGTPFVPGAKVTASIEGHVKGKKLHIQKFKRRKDYRRRTGHRQTYTRVTIQKVG